MLGRRHIEERLVEVAVQDRTALGLRGVARLAAADDGGAHAKRTPTVFASGARKRASRSPSDSADARSRGDSRMKVRTRMVASVFVRSSAQIPETKPSTRREASMIPFFA